MIPFNWNCCGSYFKGILYCQVRYVIGVNVSKSHTSHEVHGSYLCACSSYLATLSTVEPLYCGHPWANILIEGGCIIEVHNTLAICILGPNKVALLERLAAIV